MNKIISFFLTFATILSFVACGSDDDSETPSGGSGSGSGALSETITQRSCSLAEGAEINADEVSVITLEYNATVTTSSTVAITLNGNKVSTQKNPQTAMKLDIPVTLEKGKSYTLSVPSGAIIDTKDATRTAKAFTLNFKTLAAPELDAILSNPNASKEARNVYDFLKMQWGRKMLTGVQSSMSNTLDVVNAVADKIGYHPALAGFDFIYLAFSPTPAGWSWVQNYGDISAAKEQWQNNGLVSYMWHWNVPNSEADYKKCLEGSTDNMGFYCPGANSTGTTEFDIREALKDGTWQNQCIMRDLKEVAGYLTLLRDAKIPVLFRPLHEAAGNYTRYNKNGGAWFWWGRYGAEYCRKLYRLMHDVFTNDYQLNNIIWVWTIDAAEGFESQAKEWYPGNDYVDIVGVDVYTDNVSTPWKSQYNFMNIVTGGKKLTTVSECGNMPDPKVQFTGGANYLWYMVWPTDLNINGYPKNTNAYWKHVFDSEYTLSREDMPNLK